MNNELFTSDFNVFRDDGLIKDDNSSGRGVLLAIHNRYDSALFKTSPTADFEFICVVVTLSKRKLYILCCYIRPSQPTQGYQLAVEAIDSVCDSVSPSDDVIILGDFNLPYLQWDQSEDESHFVATNPTSDKEILFTDCLSDSGLFQMSCITNNLGRQLDLIFSSDPTNCVVTASSHLLSTLDRFHPPLFLTFSYDNGNKILHSEKSYCFNFRKADFVKLNYLLSNVNFNPILDCNPQLSIDNALGLFYDAIFACFVQSVPYTLQKNSFSSPPWYSKELRSLRNKRNKLWQAYLKSRSDSDFSNYLQAHNRFSVLCEHCYNEYLGRMESNIISDPRSFYKFINAKSKSDSYPSSLIFSNASSADPKTVANFFAQFFSQSFTDHVLEPDHDYFSYIYGRAQTSLVTINISSTSVVEKISKLKDDYSPGPDGLPAIVLKKCANYLAQPITALFQLSISQGVFPQLWKDSYIIPIHKKGRKNEVTNYRPIAKLSCIPKLFESIVYDAMSFHCKSIISPNQHGFLKGRSTTTNLIEFASRTLCALEDGKEVDVIATDFSKAFDKISHGIILMKLKALGFQPVFISWVKSYLTDRQYKVLFRSSVSNPINATSGVPQGSHLGPMIFILTINDVECIIKNSYLSIYADDMKIFRHISSPADSFPLQDDLDSFSMWCQKNFLELNITKCQAITYSRKRLPSPHRAYSICGQLVPSVSSLRDLGVLCDRELNFRAHIDSIIRRANSMLGYVKRWSKEFSNPYVTKSLYVTFVRPILEYASQVWSPYYETHSLRIEAVQRRFIRFALRGLDWVDSYNLPPYVDRLKLINLQSLEKRREVADIIFIHQLLTGNIDCPALLEMIPFNTNPRNLRSVPFFCLKSHRTNYGHHEPMSRLLRKANDMQSLFDFHCSRAILRNALHSS